MEKVKRVFILGSICLLSLGLNAWTDDISLGEIVVTPSRCEESMADQPGNVSVLNQKQLKYSMAINAAEAVKNLAGVSVRDYYGTGVSSSVDLRGFGEFASQNTLVMIDGRRVNEIDLSGVAFDQIPIERIDRIEVVRGAGSVLYGDNAVGGVVNIITKKEEDKPYTQLEADYGSWDTLKYSATVGAKKGPLSGTWSATSFKTDGYRDNGGLRSFDTGGKISYAFTPALIAAISANYHDSDFGMPGALRESQLRTYGRKDTLFPDDKIGEKDWYVEGSLKGDMGNFGALDLTSSFRERRVTDNLLSSKVYDGRLIDTFSMRPKYKLELPLFGGELTSTIGADYYRYTTGIDAYSFYGFNFYSGAKVQDTDIAKNSIAGYIFEQYGVIKNLTLSAGFRYEQAKYSFNSTPQNGPWSADPYWFPTSVHSELTSFNRAGQVGINYDLLEQLSLFYNYSKSFRTPATDEYYSIWAYPPVNINLAAQRDSDYDAGFKFKPSPRLTFDVDTFYMVLKNELYYDPLTFSNGNYDKTRRYGLECSGAWAMSDRIYINGSYTYTDARFIDGIYNKKHIPLVSPHKFSLGFMDKEKIGLYFAANANFTAGSYLINDEANDYKRLDSYVTVDTRIGYEWQSKEVYFEIKNLFNQSYSEYGAVSTMYSERGFYPSPGRSFNLGVKARF